MTSRAPLEGLKILIVEDEFLVAMDLTRMIRRLGAEVLGPVSTPSAATELLQTSKLDGAVMDIKLGDESSAPIAEQLRARGVPVVLTTGYANDMLPESVAGMPMISKPYNAADFREVVTKHFSHQ